MGKDSAFAYNMRCGIQGHFYIRLYYPNNSLLAVMSSLTPRIELNTKTKPTLLMFYRWLIGTFTTLSPGLAISLAYKYWFKTSRYPESQQEKEWSKSSSVSIMPHPISPIPVYQWGNSGNKILLIHGWGGRALQLAGIAQHLSQQGMQVLAFDAPGHGKAQGNETTLFEFEDVIHSLDRKYGPFQAVVAHAFGVLAAALAIRNGLKVNAMVAISSPTNMEFLFQDYCRSLDLDRVIREGVRKKFLQRFGKDLWQRMSAVNNLSNFALPMLILHDKEDHQVPWSQSQELSHASPYAKLKPSSGLGHVNILRDPEIHHQIESFLKELH